MHNVKMGVTMHFLNRTEELKRLEAVSRMKRGAFVVLYGRRRIGKTRLLLEWASGTTSCYYVADQSAESVQRLYFATAVNSVFPGFSDVEYPDWVSFFDRFVREATAVSWKGVLIIDEFPYLVEKSPELPSILQRIVDLKIKESGIRIAISGSSQKMMHGIVLDANSPLYGRADELMRLRPLHCSYLKKIMPRLKPADIVRLYAFLGGVPKYWELACEKNIRSIDTIIDSLVLDPLAPLLHEPDRLLGLERPSAMALRPVFDVIGGGANRLSEIAGRIGQPATSLSRPLARLIEMDLIQKELPFGESEKSSKKSVYKIADPFFRFWFTVVAPNRAYLMQSSAALRIKLLQKFKHGLISKAWEDLCRDAVVNLAQKKQKEKLPLPFGPAARFWAGTGPEWDVVSLSVNGEMLLLGEVKWQEKEVTLSAVEKIKTELIKKGIPPIKGKKNYDITYALFVPGKPQDCRFERSGIHVFDAEDIVSL